MIYIKIGREERNLRNADPRWITAAIRGEREAHGRVCVQVRFDLPGIKLLLTTPGCPSRGGRSIAHFNADEQRLISLWKELGLFDDAAFAPGKIVDFVQQLGRRFGLAA